MELPQSFVFKKCFSCSKNFNVAQLIELNASSVVIGDETIALADLILDICLLFIDPSQNSLICEGCKNQIVYFHMFKRDIKKYSSFADCINTLKILAQVEEKLSGNWTDLHVFQHDNCIVISTENETQFLEKMTSVHVGVESLLDQPEEQMLVEESAIIEEYVEDAVESDNYEAQYEVMPTIENFKREGSYESVDIAVELLEGSEETEFQEVKVKEVRKPKRQKTRKYRYPINTNDKLNEDEKEYIAKQVQHCEVIRNGKTVYKCPLCDTILQIPGSLKKHLRDTHILKSKKEQDVWNDRKAFKNEITESMLIVETADGPETIWKCQRCESYRIFRSEAGLKVHIRYSHIRDQVIDSKFIAKCKTTIESENGPKEVWRCPECDKILKSRDGLRNHLKLEHPNVGNDSASEGDRKSEGLRSVGFDESFQQDILNILEKKRRTLKNEPSSSVCHECGLQFINGSSKKEKSCRIHQECHKILKIVSQYYQLPKCNESKCLFSNDDDLQKFLACDQQFFEPLMCDGMSTRVSQKLKEPAGNSSDHDAWKCGHCGAKYQTEIDCIAHVMILHSKKLICPVDHMEFEGSRGISQFNIHMHNKHPDMFPDLVISCTYCHDEFSSIFEKIAHMRNCSEKKFTCDHCSRSYYTKTELLRHLKIVSGEIKYTCAVCNKSCSSTMDLKLHQTSHTNQKDYACSYPECPKAFKTPAARSSHMETHSNINFGCSLCSASFRQRSLLQRHIRKGYCKGNKEASRAPAAMEDVYEEGQIYEMMHVKRE